MDEGDTLAPTCVRQTAGEFVNVSRGVRRRVKASIIFALQGRLDLVNFLRCYSATFEPRFPQQRVDAHARFEALFVVKNVEDPSSLEVEGNALLFRNSEQLMPGFEGQSDRFNRVCSVIPDVSDEFSHPRILMPARRRIHEKRRVAPE